MLFFASDTNTFHLKDIHALSARGERKEKYPDGLIIHNNFDFLMMCIVKAQWALVGAISAPGGGL